MASYEDRDLEDGGVFSAASGRRITALVPKPAPTQEGLVHPLKEHYNIQISVQRVVHPDRVKPGTIGVPAEREITKLVEMAVTADTEHDAYVKAYRLLNASGPETFLPGGDGSRPL